MFRTRIFLLQLFWLLGSIPAVFGQIVNYVNNPSFEEALGGWNPYSASKYWEALDSGDFSYYQLSYDPPYSNAPNSIFGFQNARTGHNFIGTQFFCTTCGRGYPRNRLKQILKAGAAYCAKYYVVITNNCQIAIDKYQLFVGNQSLDTISLSSDPITYVTPQVKSSFGLLLDTLNWTGVSGTFTAVGDEKYLVLGNFETNAHTNTLVATTATYNMMSNDTYIDDVSLVEMELPAYAGRDTVIAPGGIAYIGREWDMAIDYACQWFQLPYTNAAMDTIAGMWVKPAVTTTYVVRQQLWCSGVKWDTVVVYVNFNAAGIKELDAIFEFKVWPNPANNMLNISSANLDGEKPVTVTDILGRPVLSTRMFFSAGRASVPLNDLPEGTYFLSMRGNSRPQRFVVAR